MPDAAHPTTRRHRHAAGLSLWMALLTLALPVAAQAPFKGADLGLGERLLAEHQCADCHRQKLGGDGSAIYRPLGRVNSPERLLSMVERCSVELKLSLFPEEVQAIAAVLNRDHYRFK